MILHVQCGSADGAYQISLLLKAVVAVTVNDTVSTRNEEAANNVLEIDVMMSDHYDHYYFVHCTPLLLLN